MSDAVWDVDEMVLNHKKKLNESAEKRTSKEHKSSNQYNILDDSLLNSDKSLKYKESTG